MQSLASESVDLWIIREAAEHRTDLLTDIAVFMKDVGESVPVLLAVLLIGLVATLYLRVWRESAAVVAGAILPGIAAEQLKLVFERPRPPLDLSLFQLDSYAFPSSNAAATAGCAVAFLVVWTWTSDALRRVVTTILVAGLALIGIAMVYLGAHWASDVLAGWALGGLIGAAAGKLLRPDGR